MVFLADLSFSLPLTNPVIIFSLVLFIILFAPILLNKIKVPYIIGLIVAGIIVGPYGLKLLLRDSSIVLFGTVGLLYIMFLAGLEIDLAEFKKNKAKIIFFGLVTFLLPLGLGTVVSYYVLGYSWLSSILLASMFSTHTLVSYPISSRYGITNNRAVTLTVGATMITDVLALLILASVAGTAKQEASSAFWLHLSISSLIFVCIVFFLFPVLARWFFKNVEDGISQYIFVLAMVFLASFLAEVAGLESIIGAFFAGLVLNKFVPHSSPLMNRIDFVGKALFIPFFLISVGMLVDINVITKGWGAIKVAAIITVVAILAKYLAAWITQKTFKLSPHEGKMIFGLSTSHAAATLAIILVGYNIIIGETITGEPIRLLNEDVLNGTILLILVSCTISSFMVERASAGIVKDEQLESGEEEQTQTDRTLISISNDEITPLVDLALLLSPKGKAEFFALHVITEQLEDGKNRRKGEKMMKTVADEVAGSGGTIKPIIRFDANVSKGILYTIKEHKINNVILGVTRETSGKSRIGATTEQILTSTEDTVFIHQSIQPLNTLKRILVVVSPNAELEEGFAHWVNKVMTISKEAGLPLVIYAEERTSHAMERHNQMRPKPATPEYRLFNDWDEFLILSRELDPNDLFIVVSSRKGHQSYHPMLRKLPYYLAKYFAKNSYVIIYPQQVITYSKLETLYQEEDTLLDVFTGGKRVAGRAGSLLGRIFGKKGSTAAAPKSKQAGAVEKNKNNPASS